MNAQYYFSYKMANTFKYHCLRYWRLELPRLLKMQGIFTDLNPYSRELRRYCTDVRGY